MTEDLRSEALSVIRHLRRLRLSLSHRFDRRLVKTGINIAQFGVLQVIDEVGKPTMRALSDRLGTTMGASTNLVDKLLAGGHVDRTRSEKDRRVVQVMLTPKGKELLDRHISWGTGSLARFFGQIPPATRQTFIDILGRLADYIERDSTPAP